MQWFYVKRIFSLDGGGWTVLQRRGDFGKPDEYFFKSWKKYSKGFGDKNEVISEFQKYKYTNVL